MVCVVMVSSILSPIFVFHVTGQRSKAVKHSDNLKIEGSHQMQRESNAVLVGERAAVVKHQDNLKMEGKMESRTTAAVVKGERAEFKRHTDNLKMEGSMHGMVSEAKNASQAIQKVNFAGGKAAAKARNAASSIVVGDDITSTTTAIKQHEAKRKSSATSTSTTVKTASAAAASATSLQLKQTKGSGVASTVVQSTDQEAAIQAVNTDKFASSLRESAGVQIGVQKDLSVIDAHRRQSQQHHAQTLSGKLWVRIKFLFVFWIEMSDVNIL